MRFGFKLLFLLILVSVASCSEHKDEMLVKLDASFSQKERNLVRSSLRDVADGEVGLYSVTTNRGMKITLHPISEQEIVNLVKKFNSLLVGGKLKLSEGKNYFLERGKGQSTLKWKGVKKED